jgi:hypothetical protein
VKTREVSGIVIDATPGTPEKPLGGAQATANFRGRQGEYVQRAITAVSADSGRVSFNLAGEDPFFEAHTVDYKLAGFATPPPGADKVTIRLLPTAEITGRVVDHNGKPFTEGYAILRLDDVLGGKQTVRGAATGDLQKDGRYRLVGVAPGYRYEMLIIFNDPARRQEAPSKTIKVDRPGVLDIGDFTVPDLSKPKP